ncbi:2C-methyl-D-erythritol 2,4-cyclodiphosphate synthase, putative [Plasmodium gallinaceum]|uniref:2-C-methyl-D-erythritol 2,4-cyclodiphosphate synthase n=1 Tax=Plasmodium gallinaceum TaxID=5849 RepID=A0A1J1GSI0_PLAGA|nr:2C-methyl-D-erythritol 2,4-cyclodiphosphate synthase, putative [Plasmodium gallinaceum]CRG95388.1 2C-methyl-D-erythritol 2,4-cyclodiphosphate synthase, putative [Plasmodium gallinaceum]
MFLKIYTYIILIYFILLKLSEEKNYIKKNIFNYLFLNPTFKKNTYKKKKLEIFYNGIRIGQGYDIHQIKVCDENNEIYKNIYTELKDGQNFKKLTIGGVKIPNICVLAHSDGDIIFHSLVDSILGGLNYFDIGTLFSDKNEKNKDKNSSSFLRYTRLLLHKKNYKIGNIDINVIAEVPKIFLIKNQIIKNISSLLSIDESQISIKGKTHEKLGVIGEKKAIECFSNVLLIPKD